MKIPSPSDLQARQFALLLHAGVPPTEAIQLFMDLQDAAELSAALLVWTKSKLTRGALRDLRGKAWEKMSTEEMIDEALQQHYRQLAFTLDNMHYFEVSASERQKLDAARTALEAKKAGTAGQGNGLDEFMDALRKNKIKLAATPLPRPN